MTVQAPEKKLSTLSVQVKTEFLHRLEALRRAEGERSVSAVVRRFLGEAMEKHSI